MTSRQYWITLAMMFPSRYSSAGNVGYPPAPEPPGSENAPAYSQNWSLYAGNLTMGSFENLLTALPPFTASSIAEAKGRYQNMLASVLSAGGTLPLVPSDAAGSVYRPVGSGGHESIAQVRRINAGTPVPLTFLNQASVPCYYYIYAYIFSMPAPYEAPLLRGKPAEHTPPRTRSRRPRRSK